MMLRYLIFTLLLGYAPLLKAQTNSTTFNPDKYVHTVAYGDHKITFQTQPVKKQVINAEPDKKYYWFAAGEIRTTQGSYSGKLLHGIFADYYLNGNLKERGNFKSGLKDGEWNSWTENGTLTSKITYSSGIADGPYAKYDNNGKLLEAGNYNNAQINGSLKTLQQDSTWVTTKYKDGAVVAPKEKNGSKSWFGRLFTKKEKTTTQQ